MRILQILCLIVLVLNANAQHRTLRKVGLRLINGQYCFTEFENAYIDLDDIGSVHASQKTNNYNFRQNVEAVFVFQKEKRRIEARLGYDITRIKFVGGTYSSGVNNYELFHQNSSLVAGASIGYNLAGRKTIKVFVTAGLDLRILQWKNDYYPVNFLLNSITNQSAQVPYYSANSYFTSKSYKAPNIASNLSLEFERYRNIVSLSASYATRFIQAMFLNNKPNLFRNSISLKLQYCYVIKYSYK